MFAPVCFNNTYVLTLNFIVETTDALDWSLNSQDTVGAMDKHFDAHMSTDELVSWMKDRGLQQSDCEIIQSKFIYIYYNSSGVKIIIMTLSGERCVFSQEC